jgi:LysR family transcriptional regulator, hydrogen peroxide-inducible genes activator
VELAQIRYFLALCEARSFTRAAERCGVSQPSLSNAIRALEDELGGTLVQRAPFGLTQAGKAVRPHFRGVVRHIDRVRELGAPANRA